MRNKFIGTAFTAALIMIVCNQIFFQDLSAEEGERKFHIQPLDPNFDTSKMKGSKTVIHPLPTDKSEPSNQDSMPANHEVIKIFQDAGLEVEANNMDALDRDMLYQRASRYSLEKLRTFYPNIPVEKLRRLNQLVRKSTDSHK